MPPTRSVGEAWRLSPRRGRGWARRLRSIVLALAACGFGAPAAASVIPEPVELPPIRSSATIEVVDQDGAVAAIGVSEIEALGMHVLETSSFWPEDDGVYQGVLLETFLDHAGLGDADAIRVDAADGFSQYIPREDWSRWPLLLASRRDGVPLTRRTKGPLRILYPRDSDPELTSLAYRLRWVWLIVRISAVERP